MWIPRLGWVNLAEKLRFVGRVKGARITKTADWWFVSIQVEIPDTIPVKKPAAVGIDVGLNRLATLSTGEEVENQAFLKTALKKLRQANKRLHRRKLGSRESGESAPTGRPSALSHHLPAPGCPPEAHNQAGRQLRDHRGGRSPPQGPFQESPSCSLVRRCLAGHPQASARGKSGTTWGAGDQGGPFLSWKSRPVIAAVGRGKR